jgi:hypothetical protein
MIETPTTAEMNTTSTNDISKLIMKIAIFSFYSIIMVANSFAAQTNLFDDPIMSGSKTGQTVRAIKAQAVPACVLPYQPGEPVIDLGTKHVHSSVEINAIRYECVRTGEGRERSFACFEFCVRAKGPEKLEWSCWVPDFPHPHRFQILTGETKASYACYIGSGVHLYHLQQGRDAASMRRRFWEQVEHPDVLPILPLPLLFQTLGRTNMLGLGPRTWNVSVSDFSDKNGELRLTVQGTASEPKCTFALRYDRWVLVSTFLEPKK